MMAAVYGQVAPMRAPRLMPMERCKAGPWRNSVKIAAPGVLFIER